MPYRRMDPGHFASFKSTAGTGDGGSFGPGQRDEADFYKLVMEQMARVTEEQRKSGELQESYRINLFPRPSSVTATAERDGWWYSPDVNINQGTCLFLHVCRTTHSAKPAAAAEKKLFCRTWEVTTMKPVSSVSLIGLTPSSCINVR